MIEFEKRIEIYATVSELHELYYTLNERNNEVQDFIKNNKKLTLEEIKEIQKKYDDFCVYLRGFSNMSDRYDNANVKFYKKDRHVINILTSCNIIKIKEES